MKKMIAILLVLVMVLALAACGASSGTEGGKADTTGGASTESGSAASGQLQVGYAKVDITPKESVPLAGYGNSANRMSKGMLDYMYATCMAVTDESGNTVIVMAMDLPNMYNPLPKYRTQLADKLGLPEENVMFCCSHTHSGPDLKLAEIPSQANYNMQLSKWLEEAAQEALDDRKPVTGMFVTSAETEGLNFIRRYIMNDGTYAGDNYGDFSSGIAGHESEADGELQLLKFTREGGKDVILSNFQTHPHRTGGSKKYDLSADIVGIYRQTLEQQLDCHALYFSGSSGNVNPTSRITEENIASDYKEHGQMLAQYAIDASPNFTEIATGKVQTQHVVYVGQVNHTEDHLVEYANQVQVRWENGASYAESIKGFEAYGINSPYHAISIVSKSSLPKTMDVDIYGLSIGDFSMVFAPFELFSDLGVMIKDGTPFEMTFVCCYANYLFSYMPTQLGFDHGGYGPNQCKFIPGTGEMLVSEYLTILENLYSTK